MTTVTEDLKAALRRLPYSERSDLVHFLVETLDEDDVPDPYDGRALKDVLAERLRDILSGAVEPVCAFEAAERLRRKYS